MTEPTTKSINISSAAEDVLLERKRQIDVEGWTPDHDDIHINCQMALAAICYAEPYIDIEYLKGWHEYPGCWPWGESSWKPKTYRENLVKAGALIIAEIERLDRQ